MNNLLFSLNKSIVALKRAKLYVLLHIVLVSVTICLLTIVASLMQSLYMNKSEVLADPNLTMLNARFGAESNYYYGNSPLFAQSILNRNPKAFIVEKKVGSKIRVDGLRQYMKGNFVSEAFFDTFSPRVSLGRLFNSKEYQDFSSNKVVISTKLAIKLGIKQKEDLFGSELEIDGAKYQVIGVIDESYKSPKELIGEENDFWLPLNQEKDLQGRWSSFSSNLNVYCQCDRVSKTEYNEIESLLINNSGSELPPEFSLELQNHSLADALFTDSKRLTLIVSLNIALLCLFSLAIIVNITVIRTISRTQIFAIHSVLGASTRDLISKILQESLLLSILGLVLGCFGAQYFITVLEYIFGSRVPQLSSLVIDFSYLIVSFVIFLVLFGIIAFSVTHVVKHQELIIALRGSGKGQTKTSLGRLKKSILGGQILICFLALSTNFNFMYESGSIVLTERGVNESAGFLQVELPSHAIMGEGKSMYFKHLRDSYFTNERFSKFSFVDYPPIFNGAALHNIKSLDGKSISQMQVNGVEHQYFEILDLKLLNGRLFSNQDVEQKKAFAIINNNALSQFNGAAIGQSIIYEGNAYEIIGVVSDVNNPVVNIPGSEFIVYIPFRTQDYVPTLNAIFEENKTSSSNAAGLKSALESHDKNLFLGTYEPISAGIHSLLQDYKITSYASIAIALLLVILIFSSFYNSINYLLFKQLSEIVVRIKLGMRTSQLTVYLSQQVSITTIVSIILGGSLALLINARVFDNDFTDIQSVVSILTTVVIIIFAFLLSVYKFVSLCKSPTIHSQKRNLS